MAGIGASIMAFFGEIARVCTGALLLLCIGSSAVDAATVVYDFSSAPDTTNMLDGSFTYNTPDGPSVTFDGLQYDDSGAFPDHTSGGVGVVFGADPGPATITFSPPVDLVEFYVNNFNGDFDSRPDDSKLFSITASLGGTDVFTYDRAAESTPPNGVTADYLLIAPAQPVTIDSISLANFDQDALDDLKINVVPEPAGALLCFGGLAAGLIGGGRKRRQEKRRGGHAPVRDPPRSISEVTSTLLRKRTELPARTRKGFCGRSPTTTPVGMCT
jgi:hypothetical protein